LGSAGKAAVKPSFGYSYSLQPCALAGALAAIMATMKAMRRIFDVLGRDRQLAAVNIVRSCPGDWKQGDGASRLHDPSITSTIMPRSLAMPDAGTTLTFSSIGRSSPAIAAATVTTTGQGIRTCLIFAHVGARVEIAGFCFVQSSSITGYLIGDHLFIICE
jgi:hypothetical protein